MMKGNNFQEINRISHKNLAISQHYVSIISFAISDHMLSLCTDNNCYKMKEGISSRKQCSSLPYL